METVLRTDDLIREIFSHLRVSVGHGEPGITSPTLYNAALSCRRFSSHALDALWFSLDNLGPLMSLIPNSKQAAGAGIYLTKPLKKEDLSTFDCYAKRIKEYYEYDSDTSTRYRVPVMLDLLQCLNRRHLLPNLRHLHIHSVEMESKSPDFNTFLLCPSLRYLSTTFDDWGHIASGFPRIVQLAPHLHCLDITNISIPEDLLPLVSNFHSLRELSTLNDFVVSSEAFSLTFPFADQLKIWRLASISIDPKDLSRTNGLAPQFSALTELEFRNPKSIGVTSEVFTHNLFPRLERLIIEVCPDGTNGGWSKLFSALFSEKSCLQYLEILDLTQFPLDPGDDDVFAPLGNSELQDLKELIVDAPVQKSLPTSSIHILVRVFPHLTRLNIDAVQISFKDLAILAQGLPHLLVLSIEVDGRTARHPHNAITLPLLSHGLSTIDLRNSDVGRSALFARWLDRLFPVVEVVNVDPTSKKVTEMTFILALMRSIRGDQRARICQEIKRIGIKKGDV